MFGHNVEQLSSWLNVSRTLRRPVKTFVYPWRRLTTTINQPSSADKASWAKMVHLRKVRGKCKYVWLTFFAKNVKKCWRHVELRNVIKFCAGLGKSPVDTLKLVRNSETMNPCSVSLVYKWHERFRNGQNTHTHTHTHTHTTEDDLRDGRPCVVKMTINDKVTYILFTPVSNTLTKLDVLN